MTPRLTEMPGMTLVGLSARFISILSPDRNNHLVIPALWDRFIKRLEEVSGRRTGVEWGVCESVPAGAKRSHPDELVYTAAAELVRDPRNDEETLPVGFSVKRVKPGRYAVFTHVGVLERLGESMGFIHGTWLPTSGHTLREAPHLERYDPKRFRPLSDDSELELWIPIA
jgi:AraC family transcriptional regulator